MEYRTQDNSRYGRIKKTAIVAGVALLTLVGCAEKQKSKSLETSIDEGIARTMEKGSVPSFYGTPTTQTSCEGKKPTNLEKALTDVRRIENPQDYHSDLLGSTDDVIQTYNKLSKLSDEERQKLLEKFDKLEENSYNQYVNEIPWIPKVSYEERAKLNPLHQEFLGAIVDYWDNVPPSIFAY